MNQKDFFKNRLNQYYNYEKSTFQVFPKNMLIEVSNICNHECIFCANSKMTRNKSCIDYDFTKRILNEAYSLGTTEVGFYATGEPLTNKNLEEYIKMSKNIGYEYAYLTTNGALLDEERIASLINSGIDSIKFSINAGTRETYKIIHGKDDFDKVIKNIMLLFEYRKKWNKSFKIGISSVLTKYTRADREYISDVFKNYCDEIIFLDCNNRFGVMPEVNKYLIEPNKVDKYESCPLPFNKLHISCEGYLTACCADFQNYLVVSDLNKESLEQAWNNEVFQELRKKHVEDNLKGTLCYNCMKNVDSSIKPLIEELSTRIVEKNFDKTEEIKDKINFLLKI